MTEMFATILRMSLTAVYCIGAVIVLRLLLRRQAKLFSYLLWSVVLFRLLSPFSLTSSYSLLRMDSAVVSGEVFSGGQQTVWQTKGYLSGEAEGAESDSAAEAVPLVSTTQTQRTDTVQKALSACAWIWLAGVAAMLAYSVRSAVRLSRYLSEALPAGEGNRSSVKRQYFRDEGVEEASDGSVFEREGIATPFVFGIFRPRIYLPAHLQPEERRYVLAHERVHIARKDHLIKLFFWGAVCLHWFNPLVWLSFKLMESDMEMSCDETVLKRLGEDVKQDYSRALLSMSCAEAGFHASPVAFGEGGVKSRIRNILSYKKGRIATAAVLAVLLCALAAGLMLNPAGGTQRERTEEKLRFLDAYANAFCDRSGDEMMAYYADEDAAYQTLPYLEKAGEGYTFGLSSPWPNEFRFVLTEELTDDGEGESRAEIWYYAWTSDPHVTVWKEEIRFERAASGREGDYLVTGGSLRYLDSISSREEFDEAYLIAGEYQFTDYEERGFLEGIQSQTEYDSAGGGEDRNAVYRSPETAAAWIFNLTGGSAEIVSTDANGNAIVRYTFADGDSVVLPMYNAAYRNTTEISENADAAGGMTDDVWFADLGAWKSHAYYVM